jgi:hypothetical protein
VGQGEVRGAGGGVAQTMYTHRNKSINNKKNAFQVSPSLGTLQQP